MSKLRSNQSEDFQTSSQANRNLELFKNASAFKKRFSKWTKDKYPGMVPSMLKSPNSKPIQKKNPKNYSAKDNQVTMRHSTIHKVLHLSL